MVCAARQCYERGVAEDITVVVFMDKNIEDKGEIQVIATQLYQLVEEKKRTRILLDFSKVHFLSIEILGKLINLSKKIAERRGRLVLCGFNDLIHEAFALASVDELFDIRPNVAEGLLAFTEAV